MSLVLVLLPPPPPPLALVLVLLLMLLLLLSLASSMAFVFFLRSCLIRTSLSLYTFAGLDFGFPLAVPCCVCAVHFRAAWTTFRSSFSLATWRVP